MILNASVLFMSCLWARDGEHSSIQRVSWRRDGDTDGVKGAEVKAFATPRQNGRGGKESGQFPTQGHKEQVERSHCLHRMTYDRTCWY